MKKFFPAICMCGAFIALTSCVNTPAAAEPRDAASFLSSSAAPSPPSFKMAGARWRFVMPWQPAMDLQYATGNTFTGKDDNFHQLSGTWAQDGGRIITLISNVVVFDGVISGETMTGTWRHLKTKANGTFTAWTGKNLAAREEKSYQNNLRMLRGIHKVVTGGNSPSLPAGVMSCPHCRHGSVTYRYQGILGEKYGSRPCTYCHGTGWLKDGHSYRP